MLEYLHVDSPEKSGSNETKTAFVKAWKIQGDAWPPQMPTHPPF